MASLETPGKSPILKRMKQSKEGNRQPIKLMSSLKKISKLSLSAEKRALFKNCKFASLLSITNNKESSATLVEALSLLYNSNANLFFFNEKAFNFCPREVADILGIGMNDTEVDFDVFHNEKKHLSGKYPEALYKLRRDVLNIERKEKMKPGHLKSLIEQMSVEKEKHQTLFVQILNYYYIEQFALCSTNSKVPRPTFWKYVSDMKAFEQVNWAKAIHDHLMKSISELQKNLFAEQQRSVQHSFKGCVPVLEAILFERMPSLCTRIETLTPPLVQKYISQRKTIEGWRTGLLGCEITPCCYCPSPNTPASRGSCTFSSPLITPPHSPIRSSTLFEEGYDSTLFEEGYDAMSGAFSSLKLTPGREEVKEKEPDQELEPEQELEQEPEQEPEPEPEPFLRKSTRNRKAPAKLSDYACVEKGRGRGRGRGN